MKKFTTSAQKTMSLSKDVIIKKLKDEMTKDAEVIFKEMKTNHAMKAKLKDGSTIVIASFDKGNGKTLAMIDHKNLQENNSRSEIQSKLRQKLEKIFE